MSRPEVVVQHFLFCTGVSFADRARPNRAFTLEGIDYRFHPPRDTEFPLEFDEFWFYVRLFAQTGAVGYTRPFTVRCVWIDGSGDAKMVWWRRIGRVRLPNPWSVADRAFAIRPHPELPPALFPGYGRYEFQLFQRIAGRRRVLARDFINVEAVP